MLSKLSTIKEKFEYLSKKIADPDVIADNASWQKLVKEHSNLQPIVEEYDNYLSLKSQLEDSESMLKTETDPEMKSMLNDEIVRLNKAIKDSEENLKVLLLPKDENDTKNVVLEIRGGAGGEESALFAHSLFRMYKMYCDSHKFKCEIVNLEETELGGIKEITALIKGKNAYATFKFESGVHRVQRVPETESQGRIHTSTVTVAVLPEMEEVDVQIDPKDLRIDIYRSGGAGGQNVNKVSSAVRITHIPTGIVVACQDERSQLMNKEKAMTTLRAKLYDLYQGAKESEYKQNRKDQIGSGDRSERIRTYNFPQGRVTDHRINLSLYNIEAFMDGDLDEMFKALTIADQQKKLASSED